jgi:membrane carboxypeptidase/penicillin-binding protein PbpC
MNIRWLTNLEYNDAWSIDFWKRNIKYVLLALFIIYSVTFFPASNIINLYGMQDSTIIYDRLGKEIAIEPNIKDHYNRPNDSYPEEISRLLIAREDRFFYFHPGINPFSIARSALKYITTSRFSGSSTITQQLVKNILGHENQRTLKNKIIESFYAVSLEMHVSKREILSMYLNTAYFGNRAQGIAEASTYYYGLSPDSLSNNQQLALAAVLRNPVNTPGEVENNRRTSTTLFELGQLEYSCENSCTLTVDQEITEKIRAIVDDSLSLESFKSANQAAVVVIKLDPAVSTNELLSIVGSRDPYSAASGDQINMALIPRPIGSTSKPLIYAKGFENGMRPYTLVEDIEHKLDINTGFGFYPSNYDRKFYGTMTLHQALSNSVNIPSIRMLEFITVERFNDFLTQDLGFRPFQNIEVYGLSTALGGLEMDLLTLTNYFSIFPADGVLKPLSLQEGILVDLPTAHISEPKRVIDGAHTQLVTKIISDRLTGVDQFGLVSNLNLSQQNYGVKTGTSYDFLDSWTVGFTPDFVVGVWVGNSSNERTEELSGSIGAGRIWNQVMELLINSSYNRETQLNFDQVVEYAIAGQVEYGLSHDDISLSRSLLLDTNYIVHPFHGDVILLENATVPLESNQTVDWYIDNINLGRGTHIKWRPDRADEYTIRAVADNGTQQSISVLVSKTESVLPLN